MNWKEFKVMLLGDLPIIGKYVKHDYYKTLMETVIFIEKRFNKPNVLFDDNIHALYDCLKGSTVALQEDFSWFNRLCITTYSKTSKNASQVVIKVLNNEIFKYENYFKHLSALSLETDFEEWYSNSQDVSEFIENFLYLLSIYCEENPKSDTIYNAAIVDKVTDKGILQFINSNYFRLLLDDFITIVTLSLDSQMRSLNGHQK